MRSRILVIFERNRPSQEAIQYASALSRRMDGDLVLLRLGPAPESGDEETSGIVRALCSSGIDTEYLIREGDPRSELLKCLAISPPFLAVVWGGPDGLILDPGRSQTHWLAPMQEKLGCPLITMQRKAQG